MRTYALDDIDPDSSAFTFTKSTACVVGVSFALDVPRLHVLYEKDDNRYDCYIDLDIPQVDATIQVTLCNRLVIATLHNKHSGDVYLIVIEPQTRMHRSLMIEDAICVTGLEGCDEYVYLTCAHNSEEQRYVALYAYAHQDLQRHLKGDSDTLHPRRVATSSLTTQHGFVSDTYVAKNGKERFADWLSFSYRDDQGVHSQITYVSGRDFTTLTQDVFLPDGRMETTLCFDEVSVTLAGRAKGHDFDMLYHPSLWRYNAEYVLSEEIVLDHIEGVCQDVAQEGNYLYALALIERCSFRLYRCDTITREIVHTLLTDRDLAHRFTFTYQLRNEGGGVYLVRKKVGEHEGVEFTCYDASTLFNE